MREIKFREWDQNRHEIYGGDIPGMSYGHREDFDDMVGFRFSHTELIDYEGTEEFKNKRILEQYTGLHDKNGKEIYEGDIVEFKTLKRSKNFGFENELVHDVVNYSDYSEWLVGNSLLSRIFNGSEVIGNIHENPELLEDK
jgi:uncharacterized phage protein (TIGR01671 family)